MPPVGFESSILAGEGPQTYALDRAGTGTDDVRMQSDIKFSIFGGTATTAYGLKKDCCTRKC